MSRCSRQLAALAINIVLILVPQLSAAGDGEPAVGGLIPQPAVRVRFANDRIHEVLRWVTGRSPVFVRLLAAIEASDLTVYLVEGRCHPPTAQSCLQVLPAVGGRRVLIYLDPRQSLPLVASQMAHELQHAIEVAADPTVCDQQGVRTLYARIGFPNCSSGYECWETRDAQAAERLVMKETAAGRPSGELKPDQSYFGTWKLNTERSMFDRAQPPRDSTLIIGDRRFGLISTVIRTVDLDGHVHDTAFVSRLDGRPYIMSLLNDRSITITETLEDRFKVRFVIESSGETIATGTRRLSGDEITVETHTSNASGQEVISYTVWQRAVATGPEKRR